MILYHPAKDINHCIYRFINILISLDEPIEIDRLRVLDFYYVFPFLMKEIKPWPSDIKEFKGRAIKIRDAFEKITNKKRIFFEISEIQRSALLTLSAKELIYINESNRSLVSIKKENIPSEFIEISRSDEFLSSDAFSIIINGLSKTEWNGVSGLKCRTGLLEYKYDE